MSVTIEIKGLNKMVASFRKAPQIAGPLFADAINGTLAVVHRNSTDKLFWFKTPRSLRTGFLEKSFSTGIRLANSGSLVGSIGPTAHYAKYVHFGTAHITANPFMDRIAKASEKDAQELFKSALDIFAEKLTK